MLEINRITARNIKHYMEAFKLNQTDLAKKLNCSSATVSSWTLGDSCPRIDKIDAMCEIFGCERADIVGDIEKSTRDILYAKEIKEISANLSKLNEADLKVVKTLVDGLIGLKEEKDGEI